MGANDLAPHSAAMATLDARQLVRDVLCEFLEPPRAMRCSSWSDEYRYIAKGPEKGPWRTPATRSTSLQRSPHGGLPWLSAPRSS